MKNKRILFLQEVTDQIHSKEAKKYVSDELGYHLKEAKKSWIEKGLTEAEAEEKAIEQMGSPIKLGMQLDKLHRPRVDWIMLILLITTLFLGFLPLFSLGYIDVTYFSIHKIIFVILGIMAALGMMFIDYRKFENKGLLLYTVGVSILLILHFFSNATINGISVLNIGPVTIESLIALPFFLIAWAIFFNNERFKVWHFTILLFISSILFLNIPSISTTYLYVTMVFVMIWWSKFNRKTIFIMSASAVSFPIFTGLIFWQYQDAYLKDRVLGFLTPDKFSDGAGYLILYIKDIMSKAGWFGNGNAMTKEFIPEAHTNLVFVNVTYYYGWLFSIVLVLILSLFIARIGTVVHEINDSYGKLLLIGSVALYTVQFVSNIGMTLGIFPLTSMSLPFISYGLMPVLLNSFLIGIVLSVYRRKNLVVSSVK